MVTGSSSEVAGAAVYNCTTNVPPTEGCNATSPSEVENVERSSCANYDNYISVKLIKGFESKTGDLMYHFYREWSLLTCLLSTRPEILRLRGEEC